MKIIGLDLGKKTLGVAIASDEITFARPYANLKFAYEDYKKARTLLLEILKKEEVDEIVIGYPLNMKGTPSEGTKKVDDFIDKLKEECPFPLKIHKIDERMTTILASQELHASNYKAKDMKGIIDMVAATKILDSYLERNKRK